MKITKEACPTLFNLKQIPVQQGSSGRFARITLEDLCLCGDSKRNGLYKVVSRIIRWLQGKGWITQKKAQDLLQQHQTDLEKRVRELHFTKLQPSHKEAVKEIASALKRIYPSFSFPDYLFKIPLPHSSARQSEELKTLIDLILIAKELRKRIAIEVEKRKPKSDSAVFRMSGNKKTTTEWFKQNEEVSRPSFDDLSLDDLASVLKQYLLDKIPQTVTSKFSSLLVPINQNLEAFERAILEISSADQSLLKGIISLLIEAYSYDWEPKRASIETMLVVLTPVTENIACKENVLFMMENYPYLFPFQDR